MLQLFLEAGADVHRKGTSLYTSHVPLLQRAMARDPYSTFNMYKGRDEVIVAMLTAGADPLELAASYEGKKGGSLWTMSTEDGGKLAERRLASSPVWDGMAAAAGRLYISTRNGKVLCLGKNE